MEIRNQAELTALYKRPQEGILYDSPELVLMQRIPCMNSPLVSDARPRTCCKMGLTLPKL